MTEIRTKIRNLLGDKSTEGSDIFTYGTSSIFTLSEPNIISVTDVYRNDSVSTVTYSFNSASNKVTVTSGLTSGDTIQIDYTYYPNYSDNELTAYAQAALIHLSINNCGEFKYDTDDDDIYPLPSMAEENIIALITSILINPDNRNIRLPDITIGLPNDVPTDVKIAKTIARYKKDSHGVFDVIQNLFE
jgi:hypothetical protein